MKKYKNIPEFPIGEQDDHHFTPKILTSLIELLDIFMKKVVECASKEIAVEKFFDIFPERYGKKLLS